MPTEQPNRRHFLTLTAALAAAAAVACTACPMTEALGADAGNAGPIDVGALSDYAKDGVTETWVKANKFFVVRQDNKLLAVSAVCTHKSKLLKLKNNELFCDAHGSRFSEKGELIAGKATRSLLHHGISLNGDKHVMVNLSKQFEPDHWNDEGSFIELKS